MKSHAKTCSTGTSRTWATQRKITRDGITHHPYFFLDRLNAPVQLICGANDPRCPAANHWNARDKLIELGKDVELYLYEDEGHSFLKIENVIDSEIKRVEFLARVLEKVSLVK
jgi:dipeptidyl aminopeptidase/acylaminoacyl peptidase